MHASTEAICSIGEHATTLAYMGAGADLGLISAAIGLVLTFGSSLFFLMFWPIRMAIRKLRNRLGQRNVSVTRSDEGNAANQPHVRDSSQDTGTSSIGSTEDTSPVPHRKAT